MSELRDIVVEPVNLVHEVLQVKHDGYRLIQICATRVGDQYELIYSFGLGYDVLRLRVYLPLEEELVSISNIYAPAFIYENEMHDLFGVKIKLISIDYQGNLYRTAKKTPFK